jgi:hypothetical protein
MTTKVTVANCLIEVANDLERRRIIPLRVNMSPVVTTDLGDPDNQSPEFATDAASTDAGEFCASIKPQPD